MLIDIHVPTVLKLLLLALLLYLPTKVFRANRKGYSSKEGLGPGPVTPPDRPGVVTVETPSKTRKPALPAKQQFDHQIKDIHLFKDLYFKLQNLERFPEVLPQSRDLLVSLLAECLGDASRSQQANILSIERYAPESLASFLQSETDQITREWERYIARRRAGSAAEMFQDRGEAEWWLKQIAPVKYVDGAWLGHINKITTPFALRRATKDAWQVMSEELGDGNPQMNHVYVYRALMEDIGSGLPEADHIDFIHPRHQLDEECVWKAAIAQLLVSLFPHEFLPEILGFNLHFEGLTMETMMAAKELEEFGLNPYYFVLHISIDNADSGHTAIAMHAVMKYMGHVLQTQGASSAEQAWRRVQAGFILSQECSKSPQCPSQRRSVARSFPNNTREAEVIRIFKAKAPVAHGIHCGSRIRFGGRKLDDWLEPHAFAGRQWQMDFLKHLGNLKPWVRKGDSHRSRLVQELSWGGKMFGSFTQSEVEAVKQWIDSLGSLNSQLYWSFVGREETPSDRILQNQDIRVHYPVLSPSSKLDASIRAESLAQFQYLECSPSFSYRNSPDMKKLLPLWFANPCLLESFVCIPSKTTTTSASAVVRLLRAQGGFENEGLHVAGMDEARRLDNAGLVELGLEMIKLLGLAQPTSLKEVLETWPSEFAIKMLELSMRPMANSGLLLGLSWAFVGLHEAMTSSMLLSTTSKAALMQIVRREQDCLEVCFNELKDDKIRSADFYKGLSLGRAEIAGCFEQGIDEKF